MGTPTRWPPSTPGWTSGNTTDAVTRSAWITRVLKPALYLAGLAPLLWIGAALGGGLVDGDPVEFIST